MQSYSNNKMQALHNSSMRTLLQLLTLLLPTPTLSSNINTHTHTPTHTHPPPAAMAEILPLDLHLPKYLVSNSKFGRKARFTCSLSLVIFCDFFMALTLEVTLIWRQKNDGLGEGKERGLSWRRAWQEETLCLWVREGDCDRMGRRGSRNDLHFFLSFASCSSCCCVGNQLKNWCFWTVVLKKTLDSPLDGKKIKPVNPKGNQPWIFIGRTNADAPILCPSDMKRQLIGKDFDSGKDGRQKEKRVAEDEMVG